MVKLKIPSEKLVITGNHIYKGYYAEYRSRLRQGEFLIVHLGCNGHEAAIPIGNIIFIMNDGRLLKYIPVNVNGLSLVEVGKEEAGEVLMVLEDNNIVDIDKKSTKKPLYLLDDETINEMNEEMNEDLEDNEVSNKIESTLKRRRSSSSKEITEDYRQAYKKTRNFVQLNPHPVSEMLYNFFSLIGMPMDNEAINNHSVILQNYLTNPVFSHIIFNTTLYKMFVLAYIFIYINNLGIGYSVTYDGCRISPNDDPTYIVCVAYKSRFIEALVNINEQIAELLNVMGTKIIPSDSSLVISNRFSYLRVVKNKLKPAINTKKPKVMRLSLLDSKINKRISNIVNKTVLDKAKASGLNVDDIEKYTSGALYRNLVENPENPLLPYVNEYKQRIAFETDKFYIANLQIKNTVKAQIIDKIKASKTQNKYVLDFAQDIDKYLYQLKYQSLISKPNTLEAKSVLPLINEYNKLIEQKTEKFYSNQTLSTIDNSIQSDKAYENDIEERAATIAKSYIIRVINSGISQDYREALEYILKNYNKIVKLTATDIKDIQISLVSASGYQKIHLDAILTQHKEFKALVSKMTKRYKDKSDNYMASEYRKYVVERNAIKKRNLEKKRLANKSKQMMEID